MAVLRHPHVVMFIGYCRDPPCLVSEYCPGGSLKMMLETARRSDAPGATLDWPKRLGIVGLSSFSFSGPELNGIMRFLFCPGCLVEVASHIEQPRYQVHRPHFSFPPCIPF
jgi:hypothetical protein